MLCFALLVFVLNGVRRIAVIGRSSRKFRSLITKERRKRAMAMEIILDLQKLEVPQEEDLFGSSTGSSQFKCCNGSEN